MVHPQDSYPHSRNRIAAVGVGLVVVAAAAVVVVAGFVGWFDRTAS